MILLAICAMAMDACRTFGDELPLFDQPPAVISAEIPLFEPPVVSSAPAPCLNLFEQPPIVGDRGMLNLFSCAANPDGICVEIQAIADSHRKGIAEPNPEEIAYCYCPVWCGICRVQKNRVMPGVHYVTGNTPHPSGYPMHGYKGDPLAVWPMLPADVQEYAARRFAKGTVINGKDVSGQEHGYPVWKIKRPDGTWIWAHHVRSENDIAAIRKLKPGDKMPDSTFWSNNRQDQISSTAAH